MVRGVIILTVAFCLAFETCKGQDIISTEDKDKFLITYTAGIIKSSIYGEFVENGKLQAKMLNSTFVQEKKDLYVFSAHLYSHIHKIFYAKTGVSLLGKGGAFSGSGLYYPADFEMYYVGVPIYAVVRPFTVNRFSMTVEGGLDLNYQWKTNLDEYTRGTLNRHKESSFIFSSSYLASVLYRIGKKNMLQISASRYNDLTPFYQEESGYSDGYQEVKTSGTIYTIGLLIPIKK